MSRQGLLAFCLSSPCATKFFGLVSETVDFSC